jgi:NADH:ubiquinone oxidoreductase subunit F (NADH-binding)
MLTAAEVLADPPLKMDFDALAAAKTMLGSGGIIVIDDETCIVDVLWNTLRFYHHESCGQCTPCREGTGWIEKLAAKMEQGPRPRRRGPQDRRGRLGHGGAHDLRPGRRAAMPAR